MRGQPFVISAPSGAGKSSIVAAVKEGVEGLRYSISHTSRRARAGEKEGVDYYFVDEATFKRMIGDGAFIEWARVYDACYGTSLSALEENLRSGFDVLLDLDTQGAFNLKSRFGESVLIYILPPSLEILEKRLRGRGTESGEALRRRLEKAAQEIGNFSRYDYVVINDELTRAVSEVRSIIVSERCRAARRAPLVRRAFEFPSG